MDVALYTGNGSTQTISGLNFSPDFVWIKARSQGTDWHALFNMLLGATNAYSAIALLLRLLMLKLSLHLTLTDSLSAIPAKLMEVRRPTSPGPGTPAAQPSPTHEGSITSQVRANASAGFSVVTYTGNGTTAQTVGHGLGVAPGIVIVKARWRYQTGQWFGLSKTGTKFFTSLYN
jgi:hypothetical protein